MIIKKCNKCGADIEFYNYFELGYQFGYESKYDGDILRLHLCGECLDEFADYLVENCIYNPIKEIGQY